MATRMPEKQPTDNKAIPKEGMSPQEIQERVDSCASALNDLLANSEPAKEYGPFLTGLALVTLASQISGLNMTIQHYREHKELPTPDQAQDWFGRIYVVHSLRGYQSGVMQQANMILNTMPDEERDKEAGRVGLIVDQKAPGTVRKETPKIYVPPGMGETDKPGN